MASDTAGFLGLRGTGDWVTDQRPKSWREGILLSWPNGDMPLTAIQSKGKSRRTSDPEFNWWSKDLATQSAACNLYKEATLDNLFTTETGAVGLDVYAKMTADAIQQFRAGHVLLGVDTDVNSVIAFGYCQGISVNGASSYAHFKLKKTTSASELGAIDVIDIIGSANAEGANIPEAITYDPDKFTGLTQIHRTPLDITRTARRTRLRTGDAYKEAKREALLLHGIEMEKAALFGEKTETIGDNGKPLRTSQGLISFVTEHQSANVIDFPASTPLTWLNAGEDWIDESLELLFRFAKSDMLAICGSGALLGIMKLVKLSSQFDLTTKTTAYGVKVMEWVTPFGSINLKRHPLFTYLSHRRNDVLIFDPNNLQYVYVDDTHFKASKAVQEGGYTAYDGTKEEFLTESGYEMHFPKTMMYLTGLGQNGTG